MSFDTDPSEHTHISGADFAMMCDEIKRLRSFIESIVDVFGPYPELNGTRIIVEAYAVLNPAAEQRDESLLRTFGLLEINPDKETLIEFSKTLRSLVIPEVSSHEAKAITKEAELQIAELATWIHSQANSL